MENLRRWEMMTPFEFKGFIMTAYLYKKGNEDKIVGWDHMMRGVNVSRLSPEERLNVWGITPEDMLKLDIRVKSYVDAKEGTR